MPQRPYLCVFCGSRSGSRPAHITAAKQVGACIARSGLGLVYGGGRVGLMGVVADAVLELGGRVIGVIPDALSSTEIAHGGLTELHVVRNMHERKAMMASLSSGFLTLPGGIGTLEEFFEILTWASLGIHEKPMGLLNVEGYFDPLLSFMRYAVEEHFVRDHQLESLVVSHDPDGMVAYFASQARSFPAVPIDTDIT